MCMVTTAVLKILLQQPYGCYTAKKLISWIQLPYPQSENLCYNNNPVLSLFNKYICPRFFTTLASCKQLSEFFFSWLPMNAALLEDLQEVLLAVQCWSCLKVSAKLTGGPCITIRSREFHPIVEIILLAHEGRGARNVTGNPVTGCTNDKLSACNA